MQSDRILRMMQAITELFVGPALVAGPQLTGKRPADKRRPYIDHLVVWFKRVEPEVFA